MEPVPVGKLINEHSVAKSDAIHVAILPAVADQQLVPGQHVFVEDREGVMYAKRGPQGKTFGIVDPFLTTGVEKGQRFYVFVYPNTVTSLRHVWTLPGLPAEAVMTENDAAKIDAEKWLRQYAQRVNRYDDANTAFESLIEGLRTGELCFRGTSVYGESDLDDADDLRHYAEVYLDIRIRWNEFSFRCSC